MDSAAGPLAISIQQSLLPKTALVSSCFDRHTSTIVIVITIIISRTLSNS